MLILKKVAVTGGLSSGKTSACEIFKKLGAFIISADQIVHQLLSPHSSVGLKIIDLLGEEVIEGKTFNRELIAKKVFTNKEILKKLETILHPAVLEEIDKQYDKIKDKNSHTFFIAEIPLLYEIESEHLFDTVIAVTSDKKIASERFVKKTQLSTEEFDKRMIHQLPSSEKSAKAHFTITNNGTLAELEEKVKKINQQLTQE